MAFEKVPTKFWQYFLEGMLKYEEDPKPLFAALYRLKLKDPEKIIQGLPNIYNNFLEDIAELYVMGKADGIVQKSGLLKNSLFREHILFFKDLKNAITILERERMLGKLPAAYSALSEEIPDETISKLIIKTSRKQLKEKFKSWEEEEIAMDEVNENMVFQNYNMKEPHKSYKIKEEQLLIQPSTEKAKPSPSIKFWILGVAVVVIIALLIWLVFMGN